MLRVSNERASASGRASSLESAAMSWYICSANLSTVFLPMVDGFKRAKLSISSCVNVERLGRVRNCCHVNARSGGMSVANCCSVVRVWPWRGVSCDSAGEFDALARDAASAVGFCVAVCTAEDENWNGCALCAKVVSAGWILCIGVVSVGRTFCIVFAVSGRTGVVKGERNWCKWT